MSSAAFIAACKALLAELLAAHVFWRDNVINPAIAKLNAALPTDPGLRTLADLLTAAVMEINHYRPELDRLIAETNAMVSDDPAPPPPPVITGTITRLPTGWAPNAPQWSQGMKHVTPCFHPPSGRIYFNNGDYRGAATQYQQSYNQETWSLDVAERLGSPANSSAGWRLEYPYNGFGAIQPKHPDFCGFCWDASRGLFWFVPGQQYFSNDNAPGETSAAAQDPCFKYGVFQFKPDAPIAERWIFVPEAGNGPDPGETWMSVYDPVKDVLVRCGYNGGSGGVLNILDCRTKTWKPRVNLSQRHLSKEYLADDLVGRRVYVIDGTINRVTAFSLDTYLPEDLGLMPGAALNAENYTLLLFNSDARVLEFLNINDSTIYTAPVDARPLVWKASATGIKGRMGVYDPKNKVSLWAGGVDAGANPNLTFFNYGAPVPAPIPDPAPVPAPVPSGVPGWVPLPGSVVAVPASNKMASVMYGTLAGPGSGSGSNYFSAWCSGVYAPDDGPYGSMVFCNGGDADYWGNEVYQALISEAGITWSRLNERSTGLTGTTMPGGDPGFDETWGEHSGQQPGVPHSYDQMEYLPPELGGGAKGAFMFCSRTQVYRYRAYRHPHFFPLDTKVWKRGSATPGIVGFGNSDARSWAYDSKRKRYWGFMCGTTSIQNAALWYLDFVDGLATAGKINVGYNSPDGYGTTRYWPAGDALLCIGKRAGVATLDMLNLETPTAFKAITLTGATIPAQWQGGYGFAYAEGKFYVRCATGSRQTLWEITPNATLTWPVAEITMAGVTVAAKDNYQGLWKRFMYATTLKCLMWVDDINGPVYAYKL